MLYVRFIYGKSFTSEELKHGLNAKVPLGKALKGNGARFLPPANKGLTWYMSG
jgi:hypothetical protein